MELGNLRKWTEYTLNSKFKSAKSCEMYDGKIIHKLLSLIPEYMDVKGISTNGCEFEYNRLEKNE